MALKAIDVSSKPPVSPPSPPRVDSWARGGRRSKRRAGSADAVVVGGQHHHQSEEEYAALCLIMFSRGFSGGEDGGGAIKSAATAAANKASQEGYGCSVCGKVYASYQALGGHKTSHRKPAPTPPPQPQPAVASAGGDAPAAEEKVHQCSLCLRTFPSGQALGGHKRLHYEGGAAAADGVNKGQQHVSKAKPSAAAAAVVLRDFDLNLPAAAATTAVAAMEEIEIASPEAKRARMMLVAV